MSALTHRIPRRRFLAGALGSGALLALGGCDRPRPGGGGAAGSLLRLVQLTEPTTLDPALIQDGPTIELIMQVFEGLVQWTPSNELAPALAEKWDIEDGGQTYVFHMRPGARFHNGREITAEDMAFSIRRSLAPSTASPVAMDYLSDLVGAREFNAGSAQELPGVEAPDPRTLRLRIDAPKAYFLAKLTYPTAYAVCKEAVDEGGGKINERNMVGTGPFKLAEYRVGDRLLLDAFADHYEGAPKLPRMERRILLDEGTRRDKFEAGELDICRINMQLYRSDRNDPRVKVFPRPSIFYLALNQKVYAPFKDIRVRQAFAQAIDKELIIRTVHEGLPKRAQGILPPGIPGHDPEFPGLPFDAAKAKSLLSEAGFPNAQGLPPLTLSYRASVDDIKGTALAVQDQLRANLGVSVELQDVEWNTFLERRKSGEMPFYFLRWSADYLDAQNFLSTMLHSKAGQNTIGFEHPEFDRLCDLADVEQNATRRAGFYRTAEELAVREAPWIPMYYEVDVELWNPKLQGVEDAATGHLPHKRTHFAT